MNRQTMLHNRIAIFAALLTLSACNAAPAAEPPLAGAAIGGEFTLTGEDGKQVSWSDFDGEYRTVYFGYTYCPDVCPVDTQRAMAGLKAFEKNSPQLGAQIQPLFISVDPERDTPQVLAEFTDNFHPRLIGMTGTREQLDRVAGEFAVTYSIGEKQEGGGYLVGHTNITYLFGPDGKPLALLPTDEGAEAVAAELEKWVR
ncbi:SCO family protein [Qipengyuania qiaonensis]|uniref:SCO family protein n=1 Tax=Qipengyuania qiaonensis TaxID=2867240 RepID=A0ABS7J840_9SPHN|nr:SCO family protein [Qipengyuania qiaonensis]MBX7483485.1 SCO family protein [Qipengyuania qiaonensis]